MLSIYVYCGVFGLIAIFFALFMAKPLRTPVYHSSAPAENTPQERDGIHRSDTAPSPALAVIGRTSGGGREHH